MNILIVTDKKGRVQYNRAKTLQKYISDIDILCLDKKNKTQKEYDIIYFSHFSLFKKFPYKGKESTICSITSHKCTNDLDSTLKQLKQFDRISVNNTILYSIFKPYIKNLYYTPNGVDTDLFIPLVDKRKNDRLVFGWAGNIDRAEKNYYTIFVPLKKKYKDFEFRAVITSKKDKEKDLLSSEQMVKFYHSLDFFLVTSSTEGTPNPGLEALSCGIPVISTRVGNMIEIIQEGLDGFYCNNSIDSFSRNINNVIKLTNKEYLLMKKNARNSIIEWDWSIKYLEYNNFLQGI